MKILFIVQGEGRGHLTQALALQTMLCGAGHELVGVLAGNVRNREIPEVFAQRINVPIRRFGSPGFSIGKEQRAINSLDTLIENVERIPAFKRSLKILDHTIKTVQPDLVLTFYEPMAGVYQAFYRPNVPFVAVGHQYMFDHPVYEFAPGRPVDRSAMRLFTRLTGFRATWKLALSLYPAEDLPDARLSVIPPLLREEALTLQNNRVQEDFFLIYLLNRGYAEQVIEWHEKHPTQRLECFWDNPEVDDIVEYSETLRFNRLHDTRFLELMSRCSGLVCTAGFESVSEALFLGKPVLAVPVEGHYEQLCNAFEIEKMGCGIRSDKFDMNLLTKFTAQHDATRDDFRRWVLKAEKRVLSILEAIGTDHLPSTGSTLSGPEHPQKLAPPASPPKLPEANS
ncbi:MAG: hypothetical protein F4Y00_05455 [Bacteroidetes bacterium SB0662_bin_6]|nr:hypothetical protein [Bacteroidetes bacterium SB0668_bin_1]MYE04402.1 hypothetical protein [Bacteroidetes bacterium SB0662_bin_6]